MKSTTHLNVWYMYILIGNIGNKKVNFINGTNHMYFLVYIIVNFLECFGDKHNKECMIQKNMKKIIIKISNNKLFLIHVHAAKRSFTGIRAQQPPKYTNQCFSACRTYQVYLSYRPNLIGILFKNEFKTCFIRTYK